MKKIIRSLIFTLPLLAMVVSCSSKEEPAPAPVIDFCTVTLDPHGGDVDIPITCLRITKLWKETFARSGKSEVIHPCNFDEFNDSCPRYTTTIRNLINSCCKFSYNIRKLMSDYMNTQVKAKKTILSDGNCTVTNV